MHEVEVKGDRFVVERHGEPLAALVPIEVYKQWQRGREAFFAQLRETANKVNLSEEEAYTLADKAIRAVRARRR